MKTPTFLLGLGVQKAGTSWLHDYLTSSPVAELGFLKEYHIWDLRYQMGEQARAIFHKALLGRLANDINLSGYARTAMRPAFIGNPEFYFDYFSQIPHRPSINLTGDITPNYCLLPEDELSVIRNGFLFRGIRAKLCFCCATRCFGFAQWCACKIESKKYRYLQMSSSGSFWTSRCLAQTIFDRITVK